MAPSSFGSVQETEWYSNVHGTLLSNIAIEENSGGCTSHSRPGCSGSLDDCISRFARRMLTEFNTPDHRWRSTTLVERFSLILPESHPLSGKNADILGHNPHIGYFCSKVLPQFLVMTSKTEGQASNRSFPTAILSCSLLPKLTPTKNLPANWQPGCGAFGSTQSLCGLYQEHGAACPDGLSLLNKVPSNVVERRGRGRPAPLSLDIGPRQPWRIPQKGLTRKQSITSTGDTSQPISPATAHTSQSHIACWMEPSETMIFFDWDDTLFPTTALKADSRLNLDDVAPCFDNDPFMPIDAESEPGIGSLLRNALEELAKTVAALLRTAACLGKVTIVTLAQKSWVHTSIKNFMPSLVGLLSELDIAVKSARDYLPRRMAHSAVSSDEGCSVLTSMKSRAMYDALKSFYGRGSGAFSKGSYPAKGRSWKNIISIGDSRVEQDALTDICMGHQQTDSRGREKEFRCKVVKLQEEPALQQLTIQLQVVQSWLSVMTHHDGDYVLDLSSDDILSPMTLGIL